MWAFQLDGGRCVLQRKKFFDGPGMSSNRTSRRSTPTPSSPRSSPPSAPGRSPTTSTPKSPLTSYIDHRACGPRGDDAKADTSVCPDGRAMVIKKQNIEKDADGRWEVIHTDVDGCEYFAYTIYECELKAEIRPADGLPSDIFWSINPQCEDGPNPDETVQPAPCHEDHAGPGSALATTRSSASTTSRASAAASAATPPATRCAASRLRLLGGGRHRLLVGQVPAPGDGAGLPRADRGRGRARARAPTSRRTRATSTRRARRRTAATRRAATSAATATAARAASPPPPAGSAATPPGRARSRTSRPSARRRAPPTRAATRTRR